MNATEEITPLKKQAINKMLFEMANTHTSTEDVIHNWLCDQDDEKLMQGIVKEDRTIKGSIKYCATKASSFKENNVAMIDDKTVFSWIYEYFTSEKIKQEKVSARVETSHTQKKSAAKPKKQKSIGEEQQLNLFDSL